MVSEAEIAWAAGLFEGEGTVFCAPPSCYFRLIIGSTDRDLIERLQALLGGRVNENRSVARRGHKPFWVWALGGRKAVDLYLKFRPWLSERRREQGANAMHTRFAKEDVMDEKRRLRRAA